MITSSLAPSSSLSRPYSSPDDHQTQPSTPAPIPLLSLLLRLEGNSSKYASIFDDHLLRSCVKRLLAGRTFLHSGYVDGHHASIRTSLSVKVPVTSLSSNRDKLLSLHFFVVDIQSKFKNNGNDPRFHVILPSTRIIFQKEVCDTVEDASLGNYTCELKPHQITTAPHQHLVETIRILINSFSRHRPTIPRVFLFSGPPGVGKTYAVKKAISIANSWTDCSTNGNAVHLISIRGSELMALSGGSAANAARELERQFEKAAKMCQSRKYNCKQGNFYAEAVVVFLDECDAFVSSHIVAAMLALIFDKMEGVVQSNTDSGHWEQIIVVGATNRVDAIPTFLRRPGRMEKEIFVSPPNANERFFLLETLLGDHKITQTELRCVAEDCVGFVAADLSALVRKAAMLGIERRLKEDAKMPEPSTQQQQRQQPGGLPATATLGRFPAALSITASDLHTAMIDTPASCLRDASLFAPPKTTWDDIAGDAGGAKTALRIAIEWPRTRKSAYNALGLSPPRGVLLHGPPGCGKTKLAKAAAGSAGVSFLSLSPAEVYSSSFVGDAEAVIRRAFDLARSAAPCVLFFDEIDSIIGGEQDDGSGMERGRSAEARVLSTFLNEMDGVDGSVNDGVLVLGATNRPATLDAALLRPGRFDKVIFVGLPDEAARADMIKMECIKWLDSITSFTKTNFSSHTILDKSNIEQFFNIDALACDNISGSMTGAEITHACEETAMKVIRKYLINSYHDLDITPAVAETLMNSLKNGLKKALQDQTPTIASTLEEYTRFNKDHLT